MRILCVDDEPAILRAIAANLRARGYEVDVAPTGEIALELASENRPDAVILDLGLPGMSGLDVIGGLRGWMTVPILVLSARDSERDMIDALDAGADDYVTKPFSMGELLARLRAALRRAAPPDDELRVVTTPDFVIDLPAKRVTGAHGETKLTPTEWKMVELLVRHEGKIVPSRIILTTVWGPESIEQTNYLRVYMAHIRRKLEPAPHRPRYFHTVPGLGYRYEQSTPPDTTG